MKLTHFALLTATLFTSVHASTELISSIKSFDNSAVREQVALGTNVNETGPDCITPLSIALSLFADPKTLQLHEIIDIIDVLERNGGVEYISDDDKLECKAIRTTKLKSEALESINNAVPPTEGVDDTFLVEKQIQEARIATPKLKVTPQVDTIRTSHFYNKFSELIAIFNGSPYNQFGSFSEIVSAKSSNHIVLKGSFHLDSSVLANFDPAIAGRLSTGGVVESNFALSEKHFDLLDKIDLKEFERELGVSYRNIKFLNQLRDKRNVLSMEISTQLSPSESRKLADEIATLDKSIAYISKYDFSNIEKFIFFFVAN